MTENIRGILFDKDGTLLDFYGTWIPAYQEAAKLVSQYAQQPERALEVLELTGFDPKTSRLIPKSPLACESNGRLAELWADILGLEDKQAVLSLMEQAFARVGIANAVAVPELASTLQHLNEQGLVLGLATMDSEALAHAALARFDVTHLFSFVCGYDSGYGEKPEPGMVQAFCKNTALTPSQCIMVGDTPHDLKMGRAAGVGLVVGVLSGAGERDTLAELADYVVPDIRSLEGILAGGGYS